MDTGKKIDFPPERPSPTRDEPRARQKLMSYLGRGVRSGLFWGAIVALATVGMLGFYIFSYWREQVNITKKDLRTVNKLIDEALIEIDNKPDRIETGSECQPPLDENRMRLEQAKIKIDDAANLFPKHPRVLTALGIYHMKLCEVAAAQKLFREAIREDEDFARAHNCLGVILYHNGKVEEALSEFARAAELDREDVHPLVNLGFIHIQREHYAEAIDSLKKASELKPGNSDIWELLGVAYYYNEDWTESLLALRKAVRLNDRNPLALYHLALACRKAGNHKEAAVHLENALELDQELRQSYPLLADSLAKIDRQEDAKQKLNVCMERWPDFAPCREVFAELSTTQSGTQ